LGWFLLHRAPNFHLTLASLVVLSSCVPTASGQTESEPLYEELFLAERGRLDEGHEGSRYDRITLKGGANSIPRPGHDPSQNPGLPLDDLQGLGDPTLTWRQFLVHDSERIGSESVGRPNRGSLGSGRELPPRGPGFIRKNDKAAFGTDETIAIVAWASAQILRLYPGTVPMVVGDLSKEGGGRLRPHKSHQSGRDVDLGYYLVGNPLLRYFQDATPETLDVEKTWSFLELLIATGQVEYIFIDKSLHQLLYAEAIRRGWDEEELTRLFPEQVAGTAGRGLIRHVKGHKHHMHVRFVCSQGDLECQ